MSFCFLPPGKSPEQAAHELGCFLLRKDLILRCDRKFKKPPPGQERLIKFPKKLVLVIGPEAKTFSEADFYAWRFDAPVSALVYALSGLAAVGVVLLCLFPIAPAFVKVGVVYLLTGLLFVMMGTLIARAVIAAVSWIGTGRTVWILPNALADDKPISELFTPLIDVQEPNIRSGDKYGWVKHVLLRVGTGVLLSGVAYILYTKSPGSDKVRQNAFKYRDELFDYLNVNNDRKLLTNEDGGGSGKGAAAGAGAGAGSSANAKTGGGRTVHVPAPPEAAADMESEGVDEQIEEEESAKTEL
jgi:translocation protein SEC62